MFNKNKIKSNVNSSITNKIIKNQNILKNSLDLINILSIF